MSRIPVHRYGTGHRSSPSRLPRLIINPDLPLACGFVVQGRLQEAERRIAQDTATIAELRVASGEASLLVVQQGEELEASRQLQEGLVKELGIMSSR